MMKLSRRSFVKQSSALGCGLVLTRAVDSYASVAAFLDTGLTQYLSGERMSVGPATHYRAYQSKTVTDPNRTTWVQIDLGKITTIDSIHLYPAGQKPYPGQDAWYMGESFPLRFRIDASNDPEFTTSNVIADLTGADFPDVHDHITQYTANSLAARYVRVTAKKLRPVKMALVESAPSGRIPEDGPDFKFMLAKVGVISDGKDVAVGCNVIGDPIDGSPQDYMQITRPARQDGEYIRRDNPNNVTDPAKWSPVKNKVRVPRTGVIPGDGIFRAAMQNNIKYLLDSFSTEELLRQFYEKTGKIKGYKPSPLAHFWEEDLAGSNAGRFLMGASNTVRWIKHPELEQRIVTIVDCIDECKEPNGFIMAYPADTMFYSERAAYTRAWVTHGLVEAAYSGNSKAFPLLRGYYDWYNRQTDILPELHRGANQGGQGMVANTRISLSPVGRPADIQVIQRYFEEPAFLKGLAVKDELQIWQYPYDRPHCYLLTNLEAYMDIFLGTGEQRYYDAVLGAWELYHQNWEQPGGSISIIEFLNDPPHSNHLDQELGELCGSCFWILLSQRLHLLHPEEERYVTEIEKSIYNVILANQDGSYGLRYHTHLEGKKEAATRINTCCEGQGTRIIGSFPEYIYSIADDGIYVNLFEPSSVVWNQAGTSIKLVQMTRFPFEVRVHCKVDMAIPTHSNIRIRVPSWAAHDMEVSVNGDAIGKGKPASYMEISRTWSSGDTIEFSLPAKFRASKYRGADQIPGATRYSLEYGPFLYAAVGNSKVELSQCRTAEDLIASLEPVMDKPLTYRSHGKGEVIFMPYWQLNKEEFTCFPTIKDEQMLG